MPYPTARTLAHVADEFARIKGWKRGTASFYMLQSAIKLDQIDAGADITLNTFNRSMQWLSDHWPVEKAWPEGIERPSPSPRSLDDVPSLARPSRGKGDNDGGTV